MRIYTDKSTVAQYSDEAESWASSITFPASVFSGELDLTIEGQTVTNLLDDDGNFESGGNSTTNPPTGFTISTSELLSPSARKTNVKVFGQSSYLGGQTVETVYLRKDMNVANKKFFVSFYYAKYIGERHEINVGFENKNIGSNFYNRSTLATRINITDGTDELFKRAGFKVDVPSDYTGLFIGFGTGGIRGFSYIDGLSVVEITNDECDNLTEQELLQKYNYFDETKSVDKMRVLLTGKNLFNKNSPQIIKNYRFGSSGAVTTSNNVNISAYIPVKSGSTYYRNVKTTNVIDYYVIYDANKNIVEYQDTSAAYVNEIVIPTNGEFLRVAVSNSNLDTYMLHEGSTATDYEAYTDTQVASSLPLRSVPAIADSYKGNEGKHTQNVSEDVILVEDDMTGLVTSFSNNDYVKILKPLDYVGYGNTNVLNGNIVSSVSTGTTTYANSTSVIGKLVLIDADEYALVVAKGTYADLAAAKTALAGTIIYYQLATPVITYFPSRVLNAEANGSMRQEPFIAEDETVQFYSSGLTLDASYPLASLDDIVEINKYSTADGSYTPVDRDDLTLASSTSITISSATDGELYAVSYTYSSSLSLNASLNYSYGVNHVAETKSHGKQLKQLDGKVDDLDTIIAYINEVIDDMFQEQADVAVSVTATTTETDILHLSASNTRYILRELTLKAVDPGADTITISLYGLVNDVLTVIDTFEITTANFGTYFNLIDMFGLTDFAGDEIKITATTDANSYAITGQYSHALTRG